VPPPRAPTAPDRPARRATATASPGGPTAAARPAPAPSAVDIALARLDLDRRIGQLFSTYAFGSSATEVDAHQRAANVALYGVATPAEVVTRHHLGGVILLGRRTDDPRPRGLRTGALGSPPQIAWLTTGLQAASFADSGVGLLISTDQEGGPVTRVGPPATQFPAAAVLGATGDAGLVEAVAAATGRELAALGINQVLAPVADVNIEPRNPVIGRRSFGADPLRTAAMVASAVRGYRSAGVAATPSTSPGTGTRWSTATSACRWSTTAARRGTWSTGPRSRRRSTPACRPS
jgi:beta-N-acetylhexosaminidase